MATIHTRAEWGARPPSSRLVPLVPSEVDFVAIHWPGSSSAKLPVADVAAQMRGWQDYHMKRRGWRDIAYCEAVDQNGDVWILRGDHADGSVENMGGRVYSILAVLGNAEEPSDAMKRTLVERVALARSKYRGALLKAHRELVSTACPGDRLFAWMKAGMPLAEQPDPPAPVDDKARRVRVGSYNAQLPQFAGGPLDDDIAFAQSLKVSLLAGQEMNEAWRLALGEALGFKYWTLNTLALMWDPAKYDHGPIVKLALSESYHGLVGTMLRHRKSGERFLAASVHVRPNDAFPASWSSDRKQAAKLDDVAAIVAKLAEYPDVLVAGDWNTGAALPLLERAGYAALTPHVDTVDREGVQRLDVMVGRGRVRARKPGKVIPTSASDHHGLLGSLLLGADLVPTN